MFKKVLLGLMMVLVLVMSGVGFSAVGDNIVVNGDFEKELVGWSLYAEKPAKNSTDVGRGNVGKCASLTNIEPWYSRFIQQVSVAPGTLLKLSCYAKGENIRLTAEEGVLGERLSPMPIPQSFADWTQLTTQFRSLGGTFNMNLDKSSGIGTVYFDDVTAIIVEDGTDYITSQNAIITDATKSVEDKDTARYNVACSESAANKYQSAVDLLTAISAPTEKIKKALVFCSKQLGDYYKEQGLAITDLISDKVLLQSKLTFLANADTSYSKALALVPVNDTQTEKDIRQKQEGIKFSYQATEKRIKELTP